MNFLLKSELFFSKAGRGNVWRGYAVLAYMAQTVVQDHG